MSQLNDAATLDLAEEIENYLDLCRYNGEQANIISPAYLDMLDKVIRHVRIRMARGDWGTKSRTAGSDAVERLKLLSLMQTDENTLPAETRAAIEKIRAYARKNNLGPSESA